jgi:hypothetical protein
MNHTLRNIIAVIVGWIIGSVINMSLINLGNMVHPIEGIDTNNMQELSNAYASLSIEYFVFPFLAHALGTLVGAFIATIIAKKNKKLLSLIVGIIFLLGGIVVSIMIDSPLWFTIFDLLLAYIPMSMIGYKVGLRFNK